MRGEDRKKDDRPRTSQPERPPAACHEFGSRIYLGEKRFRDIVVENAHTPIITAEQFDLAQRILHKRSTEVGRRAANPSDYGLSGLIRCPQCGRKFIGTVAHGRNRTYRYYLCWSRDRYGTGSGCDIYRYNADDLDAAIARAVLDFYTTGTDTIARAVAQFQATHTTATADHRDQLTAVARDLKQANASIDRYLTAFEKGTLDDDDDHVRRRLTALKERIKQLRSRKTQLEFELDQPPQGPTPGNLTKIRTQIEDILRHGTPNARKALFEGLIHEIKVLSDGSVRPYFRLPLAGEDEGLPSKDQPRLTTVRNRERFAHSHVWWTGGYGIRTPRPSRSALTYSFR